MPDCPLRLITFPLSVKSCESVSVLLYGANIAVRSTVSLLPLIVITLPLILSVWSAAPPPPLVSAGVNVNTPELLYVKLPLPLGVAVVTLKSVSPTLLPPPPEPVWSPASNLFVELFQTSTCPFSIPSASTSLKSAISIAAAAVVGLIPNVIVSAFASVVSTVPVPEAKVRSSSNLSAPIVVCPETKIFAKPKLAFPEPLPPATATASTELILP